MADPAALRISLLGFGFRLSRLVLPERNRNESAVVRFVLANYVDVLVVRKADTKF